jgi:hypothetical protein
MDCAEVFDSIEERSPRRSGVEFESGQKRRNVSYLSVELPELLEIGLILRFYEHPDSFHGGKQGIASE